MQDPYKTMWHITLNHLIKQLTMGDSVECFAGIESRVLPCSVKLVTCCTVKIT